MTTFNQAATRLLTAVLLSLAIVIGVRAESPATFNVGDYTFTRPAKWEWVETTSPMRKAQLKVPDAKSEKSAEVVFFQFSGGAGSTQANVDRWLGQFEEPREKINAHVETKPVGKVNVTYVQAEGTYKSGMPGGPHTPMPDYALVGAIIETESSNIFVRMTGPKDLVKASAADLKKMIEDALKKS